MDRERIEDESRKRRKRVEKESRDIITPRGQRSTRSVWRVKNIQMSRQMSRQYIITPSGMRDSAQVDW
jgi:hypothetical protein